MQYNPLRIEERLTDIVSCTSNEVTVSLQYIRRLLCSDPDQTPQFQFLEKGKVELGRFC
jgi:hypothetical protein